MTNRIVVLGANGNVGTLLLEELTRRGISVVGSMRPGRMPSLTPTGIEWVHVSLEDPESLQSALESGDAVIWTPAIVLAPRCIEVLEAAELRRVVFISSASVHTRLKSNGAREKRTAEHAIRASNLRYSIVRPTMIYGNDRDRNLSRLLRYLRRLPVFPMFGKGSGLMQPVHIDDVVEAILAALEAPIAEGRTYDLGGAESIQYRKLVQLTAKAVGRRVLLVSIPLGVSAFFVRLANRAGVRFLREEQIYRIAEDKHVDNGPITEDLGLKPRSFGRGIADQVASGGLLTRRAVE